MSRGLRDRSEPERLRVAVVTVGQFAHAVFFGNRCKHEKSPSLYKRQIDVSELYHILLVLASTLQSIKNA